MALATGDIDVVEVRASRNTFSKDRSRTKAIQLPVIRDYKQLGDGDVVVSLALVPLGFVVPLLFWNWHAVAALSASALFGTSYAVAFPRFRSLVRLGGGHLTIAAGGYVDSRLSNDLIPWAAFRGCEVSVGRKTKLAKDIYLTPRDGAIHPEPSDDYRKAFGLVRGRRDQLYIELDRFRDANDPADVITILLERDIVR